MSLLLLRTKMFFPPTKHCLLRDFEEIVIKVPAHFLDDHADRDLPTPAILKRCGRYYMVAIDDPALGELLSDARYYAWDVDEAPRGLIMSARATVRALTTGTKT